MSSIRHYIEIVEQAGRGLIRAYHGTPHQFDVFNPEHAADEHAQEGAGFYFTTHLPGGYRRGFPALCVWRRTAQKVITPSTVKKIDMFFLICQNTPVADGR